MTQPIERRSNDPWRAEMQEKIERLEKELHENTAITRELRDIPQQQDGFNDPRHNFSSETIRLFCSF